MGRLAARYVLHALTMEPKCARVAVTNLLQKRYENEGEQFINRSEAIDETWIRRSEPEFKRQSFEWHMPASPRLLKFRRKQGNLKMMMICAYCNHGILTAHRVPVNETVNQEYNRKFLTDILCPAICKKRPELLIASPLILQDNTVCHKAGRVMS